MRETIGGVIYDTDDAELLGQTGIYGAFAGDCHIPVKTFLYRGRVSGKYFKVTLYPAASNLIMKALTGSWTDEFNLMPLNEERARDCAISHGFVVRGLRVGAPIAA